MALLKEELSKVDDETRKFNASVFYSEREAEISGLNMDNPLKDRSTGFSFYDKLMGRNPGGSADHMLRGIPQSALGDVPDLMVNDTAFNKFFESFQKRLPGTTQSLQSLQKAGDISKGGFGGQQGSLVAAENTSKLINTFRQG